MTEQELYAYIASIRPADEAAMAAARRRQAELAKPPGSLGRLEEMAVRMAGVTGQVCPAIGKCRVAVFAADNGVVTEGVSCAPQSVTLRQAVNMTRRKTGMSALAKTFGDDVAVYDVGIAAEVHCPDVIDRKVRYGTADLAVEPAMTRAEALQALAAGMEAAAQAKVQENLEAAKEAIRFSWFGEFDPADEAAAWARLTAEIAVLGTDQKEKVYLSDAPNGKRKTYDEGRGFFYGASVAVRVIEEQDGWTKIEAYNDRDELEQGWVKSSRIRTVTPNQTYGIIVDKMTQRLYLYKEGRLLTTLLCSTGTTSGGNSAINETASGEFLLCSWTGGFWSGNLYCDQAIRFNGGDLMHMVPAIYSGGQDENGNPVGTANYDICESALGRRASHGCVRVQRKDNADGYSHTWLWNNLRGQKDIKIIIWDDDGRKLRETDPATPMYYNKDGGKKYHTTARCASVKSRYLPLSAITYGDLSSYPYNQLSPCTTCGAPERPEVVAAWNSVIDEAYDELGLTP